MKQQILGKTYEVSPQTKKVLDCKMLNDRLYEEIYDVVNDFYSSEAETIMTERIFGAYSQINDMLTECLGISVDNNLGELHNIAGESVRI